QPPHSSPTRRSSHLISTQAKPKEVRIGPTNATNTKVTARTCSGTIIQCARKTLAVTSSHSFCGGIGGGQWPMCGGSILGPGEGGEPAHGCPGGVPGGPGRYKGCCGGRPPGGAHPPHDPGSGGPARFGSSRP